LFFSMDFSMLTSCLKVLGPLSFPNSFASLGSLICTHTLYLLCLFPCGLFSPLKAVVLIAYRLASRVTFLSPLVILPCLITFLSCSFT